MQGCRRSVVFCLVASFAQGLFWPEASLPAIYGQIERYELGKRLQRFERSWQSADSKARKDATPPMQKAVSRFFSFDLNTAAASLDAAWMTVDEAAVDEGLAGAVPYRVDVPVRLLDDHSGDLPVSLQRVYSSHALPPVDAAVFWEVTNNKHRVLFSERSTWVEAEQGIGIPTAELPAGDYLLTVSAVRRDKTYAFPAVGFSRVDQLSERLERINSVARDRAATIDASLRATLRAHVRLLESLESGSPPETDYPVNQILELDELCVANPNGPGESLRAAAANHDVWLTLARGRTQVPVRLRSPPVSNEAESLPANDRRLGVLFLLHGAGGSENMFFQTYGAGGAVQAGLERDCLVIAPRQGLTGMALSCSEMLDALAPFFTIDRTRIFMLGHSMGAAQAIQQAQMNPDLFRGVAVIGGGRAVRDAEGLSRIGWYVAAGELDFGRRGAKAFYDSLQQASHPSVKFDVVPDVEHMVIVQAALPSTFEFFDSIDVPAER